MITSRSIHVRANGIISFFLRLSSIPLYLCTTSSSAIPLSKDVILYLKKTASLSRGRDVSYSEVSAFSLAVYALRKYRDQTLEIGYGL